MKQMTIIIAIIACICAIPFLLPEQADPQPEPPAAESDPSPVPVQRSFDKAQPLRVQMEDRVETMSLHEYLVGVLLAEVPGDFPAEALKSQAVASRTFALKKMQTQKHPGADVCASASCCQGWSAEGSPEGIAAITAAIEATDGLVLTYDGNLIDATFFSCSGGKTEAALAVWGSDVPYLQSVDSPGEENAPRYTETVVLDRDYFSEVMTSAYPQINLSGSPMGWFGPCSWTEGGGLDLIFIGGLPVSGTDLRRLFSLRSTDITFTPEEDAITVTTYGFGHRVGMSQYGAAAMAEAGEAFTEILSHYYQNTTIKKLLCRETEQFQRVEKAFSAR